ncbi:SDR family oxidoreductase [Spelaeicoccus albus]|uniref:NAD(P)-dependent dehydrogenase (Short-subunit alcohol dehydrogenase family) n=1 Tax=Spelaeicoccus albus TaxID=1280376 RepID=A0A7Z0D1T8_9MICO|nr:SDR family oxidoreductase [Spelaeicoccus albus]NYI66882.1 NAD(P)-dependent dehydrogenase (short-subunit alcohol dehydrogenase family) [Spelaeicoccus albus]
MHINNAVVLVTGANRGIGRAFVAELLARGAAKIYAAARDASSIVDDPRVVPVALDITNADAVADAASFAADVNVLINNAGITTFAPLVGGNLDDIRREMETNYFGTLAMVRAFAPALATNGGGSILNVSSAAAWLGLEHSNGYGASKAAVWAMTNALRVELSGQNTQVTGLYMASTDTDMIAAFDMSKNTPQAVVIAALDGLEAGELEVLADDETRTVKATLSADPVTTYPQAVRHIHTQAG